MKIFNRNKYQFTGVKQLSEGDLYYSFELTNPFYSKEICLVKAAKLLYDDGGFVYFDESELDESSCVNQTAKYSRDLLYNESKWQERDACLNVKLA